MSSIRSEYWVRFNYWALFISLYSSDFENQICDIVVPRIEIVFFKGINETRKSIFGIDNIKVNIIYTTIMVNKIYFPHLYNNICIVLSKDY